MPPSPRARLDRYHDAALLFDHRPERERLAREARGYAARARVRAHLSTYARLLLGWDQAPNVIPFSRTGQR